MTSVGQAVVRRWVSVDDPRWRQAHASTVLTVGPEVLAAWFAGTREGAPDTRVWLARRNASGHWGVPRMVLDADEPHWNPVLAQGPDGEVWLFVKRGATISAWSTWVARSDDGGRSWSDAVELVPGDFGGRGPVKNPPVLLEDGTWLAPGSLEQWQDPPAWYPFVDRSTDGGRTWAPVPVPMDRAELRGAGAIQPALWSGSDGVVNALLRTTEGVAYRSWSEDGGRTWATAMPTSLPNNNSGLTVVGLPDGRAACVHNPVSGDWAPRCPLVVSVSDDDGLTWNQVVVVEDGRTPVADRPRLEPELPAEGQGFDPADGGVATTGVGEYSYPSAVLTAEALLITYTWQRRGVVEARVSLDLLNPSSAPETTSAGSARPLPGRTS